jgi:hypothetical protein
MSPILFGFPQAENLLVTLPELDGKILEYCRLLGSLARSDPNRPTILFGVATPTNQA